MLRVTSEYLPVRVTHEVPVPYVTNYHHAIMREKNQTAKKRSETKSILDSCYGQLDNKLYGKDFYNTNGLEYTPAGKALIRASPIEDTVPYSSDGEYFTPRTLDNFSHSRRSTRAYDKYSSYINDIYSNGYRREPLYSDEYEENSSSFDSFKTKDKYGLDSYFNRYGSYKSFGDMYGARGLYGDYMDTRGMYSDYSGGRYGNGTYGSYGSKYSDEYGSRSGSTYGHRYASYSAYGGSALYKAEYLDKEGKILDENVRDYAESIEDVEEEDDTAENADAEIQEKGETADENEENKVVGDDHDEDDDGLEKDGEKASDDKSNQDQETDEPVPTPKDEVDETVAQIIMKQVKLKREMDKENDRIADIKRYKQMKQDALESLEKELESYSSNLDKVKESIVKVKEEIERAKSKANGNGGKKKKKGKKNGNGGASDELIKQHLVVVEELEKQLNDLNDDNEKLKRQMEKKKTKMVTHEEELDVLEKTFSNAIDKIEDVKQETIKAGDVQFEPSETPSGGELSPEAQKAKEIIQKLNDMYQESEDQVFDLKEKINALSSKYKKYAECVEDLKQLEQETVDQANSGDYCSCQEELKNLKSRVEKLLEDVSAGEQSTTKVESAKGSTITPKVVVPSALHSDASIKDVLTRLSIRAGFTMKAEAGGSISASETRPVLLPVIAASRIGSDVDAAVDTSKVKGDVKILLVIFHHLAEHNSEISSPTADRLQNRDLVDRCSAIVDVVYWNGKIYDCKANEKAVKDLDEILKKDN